jgi:hypothetical protein
MTLHFSHIGLTDGRTFMVLFLGFALQQPGSDGRKTPATSR